jgi:hypothetical protein
MITNLHGKMNYRKYLTPSSSLVKPNPKTVIPPSTASHTKHTENTEGLAKAGKVG